MKKLIVFVLVSLMLFTSACAPKKGTETTVEIDVELSAQTVGKIKVGCPQTHYASLLEVIKAFNVKYPKIEVQVLSQSNNDVAIMNWHNSDVQKPGSSPDIFYFADSDYQAKTSILKNLDPYFSESYKKNVLDKNDIAQEMLSRGKSGLGENAHQYLIGTHYDQFVTYINKKLFEEAKVDLPNVNDADWTMEMLLSKLDDVNTYAASNGLKVASQMHLDNGALYLPVILSHGVELFGQGGEVLFNNSENLPKMVKAMEYMQKLTKYSVLTATDASIVNGTTPIHFQTKIAMSGINDYDEPTKQYPQSGYFTRDLVDVRPFPAIKIDGVNKPLVGAGTHGYSMYRYTRYPNEAWAFLQFLLSKNGQEAFVKSGNHIPMLKSMQNDVNAAWKKLPIEGYAQESFVSYPERIISLDYRSIFATEVNVEIDLALSTMIQSVINKSSSIDAAIKTCADKIIYEKSKV